MTITLTREEAQQVLDSMENAVQLGRQGIALSSSGVLSDAIETLRARLSAPEPEQTAKHYGYLWYTHHMERRFTHYKPEAGQYFGSEPEPVYTAPPQRERVQFPTMLRKMWSGGEVQAWLDENVNKEMK